MQFSGLHQKQQPDPCGAAGIFGCNAGAMTSAARQSPGTENINGFMVCLFSLRLCASVFNFCSHKYAKRVLVRWTGTKHLCRGGTTYLSLTISLVRLARLPTSPRVAESSHAELRESAECLFVMCFANNYFFLLSFRF